VPVVVFSLLRIALFAVCFAVLWWVGMRSWLTPVVAAFLAWGISYVLLSGPRDAAARHLEGRAQRTRPSEDDASIEDAADEESRQEPSA